MHKLIVMYPQPEDQKHFLDYYINKHAPLAAKLPGLIRASFGRPKMLTRDYSWFLIWEGEFESSAQLVDALKSDIGSQVSADVQNYSPKGATMLFVEMADIA